MVKNRWQIPRVSIFVVTHRVANLRVTHFSLANQVVKLVCNDFQEKITRIQCKFSGLVMAINCMKTFTAYAGWNAATLCRCQDVGPQVGHQWDTTGKLERNWNTTGTQVKHNWNTTGTQVEHSWNTTGTQVEHRWKTGTKVEHNWNTSGTQLEHNWNTGGKLERKWNKTGTQVEHNRKTGTQLEHIWDTSGTQLEHNSNTSGTQVERNWNTLSRIIDRLTGGLNKDWKKLYDCWAWLFENIGKIYVKIKNNSKLLGKLEWQNPVAKPSGKDFDHHVCQAHCTAVTPGVLHARSWEWLAYQDFSNQYAWYTYIFQNQTTYTHLILPFYRIFPIDIQQKHLLRWSNYQTLSR